jgi:hypothetical protein
MNWKIVFIGGVAYYVALFLVSIISGYVVHEILLDETYQLTTEFWRPELRQDPPDMAALMPMWVACGLIGSFVAAFIYGWVRPALAGSGVQRGLKFGLIAFLFHGIYILNWQGVFNLPEKIWIYWWLESFVYLLAGSAALGWVAQKIAPVNN